MGAHKVNGTAIVALSRPKCPTCVHFVRDGAEGGHCRRFPPTPFYLPQQTLRGAALALQSSWPPTLNERWCGEHQDFLPWLSENRENVAALDELEKIPAPSA